MLLAAISMAAQSVAPTADAGYPEQAYLSQSRYVNAYFGFTFELPSEAHLHKVPEPASRDASIPLLALAGPAPADAQVFIAAIPTDGGKGDAKLLMRQALDQDLYRGVEELRSLSKANLSGHEFYFFETRRGIEQHMLMATAAGDYVLRVVLASHDEKTVKRLESALQRVVFFAPAGAGQYVDAEARPYDGPSISSHRLAVLDRDPPATRIDAGNISGDFYENSMLGFSYRIPQGWSIEKHGAVQPAVEEYRMKQDLGRPRMGGIERRLVDDCSRTLFSAWAQRPGPDGQVSYDSFGEVTVSAMSLGCFPNMTFPANTTDRDAFKSFLAEFALTHPIVDDMREGKVFTQDGITFLFLQGTVAFQVQGDELSRRLSLGMAITQRRGYLLTWFFAAPHDEELRALTNERASFDRGDAVTAADASQPGGGVAAEPSPFKAANAAKAAEGTAAAPAPAQSADATIGASSKAPSPTSSAANAADAPSPPASASSSSRPSLLRPGETMESQQEKGVPIKKAPQRPSTN